MTHNQWNTPVSVASESTTAQNLYGGMLPSAAPTWNAVQQSQQQQQQQQQQQPYSGGKLMSYPMYPSQGGFYVPPPPRPTQQQQQQGQTVYQYPPQQPYQYVQGWPPVAAPPQQSPVPLFNHRPQQQMSYAAVLSDNKSSKVVCNSGVTTMQQQPQQHQQKGKTQQQYPHMSNYNNTIQQLPSKRQQSPPSKRRKVGQQGKVLDSQEAVKPATVDVMPSSLMDYVARVYSSCKTDAERDVCEESLSTIIRAAKQRNELHTRDWGKEPFPVLVPPPKSPSISSDIQARLGKRLTKAEKKNQKALANINGKKKASGEGINKSGSIVETAAEKQRRNARVQRFEGISTATSSSLSSISVPKNKSKKVFLETSDENSSDWSKFAIVGTCQNLEKEFLRLTEAPNPKTVRPESVLRRTMKMLHKKWLEKPDYVYTNEQMKSLRQDLIVQCIRNSFAAQVYETHARIALEQGDMGEFNQCQTQLRSLFEVGIGGCRLEFLAYRILYCVYTNSQQDMMGVLKDIPQAALTHSGVVHAMKVQRACLSGNYVRLAALYLDAPNMGGYIMDHFINRERLRALRVISRAFRPSFPVSDITRLLAFDNKQHCLDYLEEYCAVLSKDKEELLGKESLLSIEKNIKRRTEEAAKKAF